MRFKVCPRRCAREVAKVVFERTLGWQLAIDGLWEDNRPTLVGPLVNLATNDPVAEVRAAAAIALGRFVLLGALGEISEARAAQAEHNMLSASTQLAATAVAEVPLDLLQRRA